MSKYWYHDGESPYEIAELLRKSMIEAAFGEDEDFVELDDVICGKVSRFFNWVFMIEQLMFALDPRESEVL